MNRFEAEHFWPKLRRPQDAMPLKTPNFSPDPAAFGKPPSSRSLRSGGAVRSSSGGRLTPVAGSGLRRSQSTPGGDGSRSDFMARMPENNKPRGWNVSRFDPQAMYYVKDSYSDHFRPHMPDYPYHPGRSSMLERIADEKDGTEVPPGWSVPRHAPNMMLATLDSYTGNLRSSVKTSLAPLPDLHKARDDSIDSHTFPPNWSVPRHAVHMMEEFVSHNGMVTRPEKNPIGSRS